MKFVRSYLHMENGYNIHIAPSTISDAGRGVFANEDIAEGEVIERAPALVLPKKEYAALRETTLRNYYFMWGDDNDQVALALGYGSLYNHSYEPNATYKKRLDEEVVEFVAIKPIRAGEEITVNYNYGQADDKSTLWIEDIPPAE